MKGRDLLFLLPLRKLVRTGKLPGSEEAPGLLGQGWERVGRTSFQLFSGDSLQGLGLRPPSYLPILGPLNLFSQLCALELP
jgi:hypothetical protein